MIWVPNQLVGAPAGTNVTIDCHTEAYPRAISYWVHENVMILPTKKYGTETAENSYRSHMKLTIRDLRERDFGNYRCISKNSLGETEGSIRLYGQYKQCNTFGTTKRVRLFGQYKMQHIWHNKAHPAVRSACPMRSITHLKTSQMKWLFS
jgi:hypothetical protein